MLKHALNGKPFVSYGEMTNLGDYYWLLLNLKMKMGVHILFFVLSENQNHDRYTDSSLVQFV